MSSVKKTLKPLVWSAQNRSISCKICPENNHKICRLFTDYFPAKFTLKIPAKLTDFSTTYSPKIPRNVTFFLRIIRSPAFWTEEIQAKGEEWSSQYKVYRDTFWLQSFGTIDSSLVDAKIYVFLYSIYFVLFWIWGQFPSTSSLGRVVRSWVKITLS